MSSSDTDISTSHDPGPDPVAPSTERSDFLPAKIVYGLFALGFFLGGITSLAGVIYAYVMRGRDSLVNSHLTFLIRTFWISLGIGLLGLITAFLFIGILLLIALLVWTLTRLITGFVLANDGKPISGTKYFGFLAC